MLDMAKAREAFEESQDFTVGIEEEFQILDPDSLALSQRFEELYEAGRADDVLEDRVAGELISSEIEIRSAKGDDFGAALASQREARGRLFALAAEQGIRLGATGTHPFSPWQEQRIIDTEHYRRLQRDLGYVARRNNTWSIHVHVGVQGAERAIAVCDRLRPVLPELLAISANSPFLDGHDAGLHSARTQIFTKSFPRCGIPEDWGSWAEYASFVEFLHRTASVVEATQLWWSVRPHHSFGTVEVRICEAQSGADEATAVAGLAVAAVAQAAIDYDDGVTIDSPKGRLVEENMWRAIRYGLDGTMIDLQRGEEFPAAALPDRLLAWTAPARSALGIDIALPERNGAQRQRAAVDNGMSIEEAYAAEVAVTQHTFAREGVAT
ncbi:MAG: glutamate---cysteine ligase / carboxylate-amine ligase [Thermoleophilaceae bacterium]|jgi:carboxylate-amine ligase|nr:glutamate---cysteine ligase / carboxylate-amine ligase [Thermoleophilaceae bacterium]